MELHLQRDEKGIPANDSQGYAGSTRPNPWGPRGRRYRPSHDMPFRLAVKQLHARIISHKADVRRAVRIHRDDVPLQRRGGRAVEPREEIASIRAIHDLDHVPIQMERMRAIIVVHDLDLITIKPSSSLRSSLYCVLSAACHFP